MISDNFLSDNVSLFQCCLPLLPFHKLVYAYIPLFHSHTEKKKRPLNFYRTLLRILKIIPLHESLFHCVQAMLQRLKADALARDFNLFHAAPFLNSKYQFHRRENTNSTKIQYFPSIHLSIYNGKRFSCPGEGIT